MSSAAEQLSGRTGRADQWLDRGPEGVLDLGRLDWRQDAIIRGIEFQRARLSNAQIGVNFVDCRFAESEFIHVRTRERFWGASNRWRACSFIDSSLTDVVSPSNVFERCVFTRTTVAGYVGYETLFDGCVFEDLVLDGFSARVSSARGKPFAKVAEFSVNFVDCRFVRPIFRNCRFRATRFDRCEVIDPVVEHSDLSGVSGAPAWWAAVPSSDLFEVFLAEVLARVEEKLGRSSASYRRFAEYVQQYRSGETSSKDYSECLFAPDVPASEMDELDDDLDELERKYRV